MKELKPVNLYIPSKNQLVCIKEGSGDNLSYADRYEGYIDYIYYTQYDLGEDPEEVDGGIILRKEFLADTHDSLEEVIDDVIDMAYSSDVDYVILKPDND